MAENQSLAPEKLIDKLTHAAHVGDNRGLEIFAACDDEILKQVLPHCTVDQLKYVEKCLKSKGRDLSPVTDKLWKKLYERKFGVQNANVVTQRMKERKVWHNWVALYEAKLKEVSDKANRAIERVGKLYEKEKERKQSRQVKGLAPQKLIDKLTHAAYVGDNRGLEIFAACDVEILKQVLPHCTVDQLKYVEKCLKSKGRDLGPVTDKLWKKFYERKFGVQSANVVAQRMKERMVWYKWVALYKAKLKLLTRCFQKECNERM
ncbi:hypothetical protein SO802_033600 [Lithocarpus litseifolius]|uniref:Elongin-A n=1 Tax=Lithocarpus litseifolius TaxID=425828 RepID=A0AAW2BIX9_9ROSI